MEEHRREGDLPCEFYPHHDHSSHLRIIYTLAGCITKSSAFTHNLDKTLKPSASLAVLGETSHQATMECCRLMQGRQRTQKNRMSCPVSMTVVG